MYIHILVPTCREVQLGGDSYAAAGRRPTTLPSNLRAVIESIPTYLLAYLPIYLPTYLPADLPRVGAKAHGMDSEEHA